MHAAGKVVVLVGAMAALGTACGTAGIPERQATAPAAVVTDDGILSRGHEAPSVVIDRRDADTVYLAHVEMFTGECRFHVSTDAGRTWTEREAPRLEPYTDCGLGPASPKNVRTELIQGPDGTLYYAFHAHDPKAGGARSVLLGRSTDGGATWRTTAIHAAPRARGPEDIEVNFLVHLAIDPDDPQRVYAMWRRSYPPPPEGPARPTRAWMAMSDDGGDTFGDAFLALQHDIGFDGPRPVVADGRLYAFYRIRPEPDASEGTPQRLAVGVSDDGGESWEETVIAQADDASEPIPAYDRERGTFHVVWHDNRNGDLDAFVSTSSDGVTWSEPLRLNDDPEETTTGQFYPQLALAPDGRLDVAWYDYRDDTYPAPQPDPESGLNLFNNMGKQQSVYLASSADSGRTWTPNVRVNDVRIDRTIGLWDLNYFFQVPLSVASSVDTTLVAWSDTRNGDAVTGTQDIVTAAVAPATDGGDRKLLLLGGGAGLLLGAGLTALAMLLLLRRWTRSGAA